MAQILFIEPDKLLASTYQQTLESAGHTVIIAPSAQTAIFAADEVKPDIVVLELQLIEHSGIEFLYEFRSYPEWQTVPVIVHSSVPPAEFSLNRILLREQLGVQLYLYKPHTSLSALLEHVAEAVAVAA